MITDGKIEERINGWKNKLLDLGNRNRLINYKDTAKGSVRITSPDCISIYNRIVVNEKPIVFPKTENETGPDDENVKVTQPNSDIETNKTVSELQAVLRNIRNRSKLSLEELGVNTLYLCFGFLVWKESANSEITHSSPLVLVPVSLTVESLTAPYKLSLFDDEIVLNPTLAYKLLNDYGIKLPVFNESISLTDFFAEIETAVSSQGWSVKNEVSLCTLSFSKLSMYEDLGRNSVRIKSNPIVRAMCGDTSQLQRIPEDVSDYDFDKKDDPKNVFQIIDADSSQQEAILLAKRGVSFILQGPPGTGKSQTITNIIAESIAGGKSVLFVAEKMAALDVVYKRLKQAGLADFCLVLHSDKNQKRNVLDQLDQVIKLSEKKATISDEAYQRLYNLQHDKQMLNDYVIQLHTKVKPVDKSIYEANGILAALDETEDLIFNIDNIGTITKDDYNRLLSCIKDYTDTLSRLECHPYDNPWRGTVVSSVTNEFRHDFASKISELTPKFDKAYVKAKAVNEELTSDLPCSLNGINDLISLLSALNGAKEIPSSWILGNEIVPLYDEIGIYERKQSECLLLRDNIKKEFENIEKAGIMPVPSDDELKDTASSRRLTEQLSSNISSSEPYRRWEGCYDEAAALFLTAQENAERIIALTAELKEIYEDQIFEIDHTAIRGRIRTEYTSFLRGLKKQYKEDKKLLQLYRKEAIKKISFEELCDTVEKLHELSEKKKWFTDNTANTEKFFGGLIGDESFDIQGLELMLTAYSSAKNAISKLDELAEKYSSLDSENDLLIAHYQFLYKGIDTDWNSMREALNWACEFRKEVERVSPSNVFVEKVCSSSKWAGECCTKINELRETVSSLEPEFSWFALLFVDDSEFYSTPLDSLSERARHCKDGMSLLEEWIDYRKAQSVCLENGLRSFIIEAESKRVPANKLDKVFKKRFFRLWLDEVQQNYPSVRDFRAAKQNDIINEFRDLDTEQFRIAQKRIKLQLINSLPNMDHITDGMDEISILKKELNKQRKIKPIRKLFAEIPNLLRKLKPCLMMSPLTVSMYLESDSYSFDLVIFDEASQIYTENAIGAISRAKQVIIAGDSKQLPPTNFFQASTSDDDYDDDSDEGNEIGVYDSILEEANLLPERTLRWHYRSRHESLIAFSNVKIYKNRLITFPSNIEKRKDIGVEFISVPNGYYDRGGNKGNPIEAQRVAELVFEHFTHFPNRSLGVIAFGDKQQVAIENAVRKMRLEDRNFERFFVEAKEEPFFIKNLENVQGDERDTIIFSIGYARDAAGVFRMNFGPLGRAGGERRLNVAITRAKYNIKLVGSIAPSDINADKISNDGPKLLKAYMDYAINGSLALERAVTETDIAEHDSPFEESVYNYLDRKGYKLATQVGCSGYRIDMAVKHPDNTDEFVLGIECDGASYHSAKTARERDRLRQSVLEKMGWKIYRIWSTDWIKDPAAEGHKLIQAIEDAIRTYGEPPEPEHTETESDTEEYLNLTNKPQTGNDPIQMYGFQKKLRYSFDNAPRDRFGSIDLRYCMLLIVNNEYPVHFDLLCQKLAPFMGYEKVTPNVKDDIFTLIIRMNTQVVKKGDFVFPSRYDSIPVRIPNERQIQHISDEELMTAMIAILRTCVGTTREGLIKETARVYGFQRIGPKIKKALDTAISKLILSRIISEVDGKLSIGRI